MAEIREDEVIVNGVHIASKVTDYIEPPKIIQEKLEDFRDMKLGFMVHWGIYNQLGLFLRSKTIHNCKNISVSCNVLFATFVGVDKGILFVAPEVIVDFS